MLICSRSPGGQSENLVIVRRRLILYTSTKYISFAFFLHDQPDRAFTIHKILITMKINFAFQFNYTNKPRMSIIKHFQPYTLCLKFLFLFDVKDFKPQMCSHGLFVLYGLHIEDDILRRQSYVYVWSVHKAVQINVFSCIWLSRGMRRFENTSIKPIKGTKRWSICICIIQQIKVKV